MSISFESLIKVLTEVIGSCLDNESCDFETMIRITANAVWAAETGFEFDREDK